MIISCLKWKWSIGTNKRTGSKIISNLRMRKIYDAIRKRELCNKVPRISSNNCQIEKSAIETQNAMIKTTQKRRTDNIGRLLVVEFANSEDAVYEEIMRMLETYPNFQKCEIGNISELLFPGLEIYPARRKIYRNKKEVHLTVKEYELLCLLAANKGRVLTYSQIYEKIWGDISSGGESDAIGFHICNLRKKLYITTSDTPFIIKCVRQVGYCFEVKQ